MKWLTQLLSSVWQVYQQWYNQSHYLPAKTLKPTQPTPIVQSPSKVLLNIEGSDVNWNGVKLSFQGRGRIDDDGTGLSHNDKYHQNDTSLHLDGKPLNADVDSFFVLPKAVILAVKPAVLGSQGYVTYKGVRKPAVVGDIGPSTRLGEISVRLAQELNINSDANKGGVDLAELFYEVYPGVPAIVDGKRYQLQKI